jgi:hypothetical protein
MTGGALKASMQIPALTQDYPFDLRLQESKAATDDVYSIIESLITASAQILYVHYMESQKVPYASHTLARELVLNASWSSVLLESPDVEANPDADLPIPPIDEWAGGALPVRNTDTSNLRTAVTPQREFRQTGPLRRTIPLPDEVPTPVVKVASSPTKPLIKAGGEKKPTRTVILTEGQIITKQFEEARKKSNSSMKAITVDSDFTVIQVQEPKGLPPALIIPKVVMKAKPQAAVKPPTNFGTISQTALRSPPPRNDSKKKRKLPSMIIQPDIPVFDEEIATVSYSDRFVCAAGVTFRDGNVVKSRPPAANAAQMSRSQYDAYLEEMKRGGE